MDPREPIPSMESAQAEFVHETSMRAEEVCACLGISHELLEICLRWDIVQRDRPASGHVSVFSRNDVERIRVAIRLHQDLDVNWAGAAVILDLLERVQALERELEGLQRGYGGPA